jgi:hypothetical protein
VLTERFESTKDLTPIEHRFIAEMQRLRFGRFERLPILHGQLVLEPWPKTVRGVKFAPADPPTTRTPVEDFELKHQVIELFRYVRDVGAGEIRCLEVRHGLPFSMEVEDQPSPDRGHRG